MKRILVFVLIGIATLVLGQQYAAQTPTSADKARLNSLEHAYKTTKAVYEKKPKDATARQRFITAAVRYGHESMISPVLDRKIKYRQALHIYREVLKIDPKNPVAKPESDMIVSIYKSMGRPVPKD